MEKMTQKYAAYTPNDFKVWRMLFERQMGQLPGIASEEYLEALKTVGFNADRIPNFEEVNAILREHTGWSIEVVKGLIPNREFYTLLRDRKFPASTWLRRIDQLDYLQEPDMFHDVFGHIPLLTNQYFCDFLAEFSKMGLRYVDNDAALEMLARIYWYTVEFGLMKNEQEGLRIYGAGILSSSGESEYCMGPIPELAPYDPYAIVRTPYIIDRYQAKYFLIESYEQLFRSIPDIDRAIEQELAYAYELVPA
jgi:phenylalanine-4-hydroxylase